MSKWLRDEPRAFDFFQAVRLLERFAAEDPARKEPVGSDANPAREAIRFRGVPSLGFPAAAVAELSDERAGREADAQPEGGESRPVSMSVSLFGLIGATGALPEHYTELLIRRLRLKDRALLAFLDLFNHRAVSFLYRAWGKYRLPIRHERSLVDRGEENDVDRVLWSLIGFGTPGMRRPGNDLEEEAHLYYSGHLARKVRPARDLESLLGDHFDLPVRVRQFRGHWLFLCEEDCTRLGASGDQGSEGRGARNNRLGRDALLGDRVWDVQGKFRLAIGPLGYDRYLDFLPGTRTHRAFRQLVRLFAGPELDFDIELVLRAAEAPPCHLGGTGKGGPYLGWNTWLHTRAAPLDVAGAVFRVEEV